MVCQHRLHRGDVDDLAGATPGHAPSDGLGDVERTAEIGLHQGIPVVGVELEERCTALQPGVVHQDVRGAVFGDQCGHAVLHRCAVGDVEHRLVNGTGPVDGGQGLRRGGDVIAVAAVDHDGAAGRGQAGRQRVAETSRRARDQGQPPADIEQGCGVHGYLHLTGPGRCRDAPPAASQPP